MESTQIISDKETTCKQFVCEHFMSKYDASGIFEEFDNRIIKLNDTIINLEKRLDKTFEAFEKTFEIIERNIQTVDDNDKRTREVLLSIAGNFDMMKEYLIQTDSKRRGIKKIIPFELMIKNNQPPPKLE